MASSVCPARRSLRMWDAEAIPSAAPPSWGPPRRGNVIGSMEKSARRRAFRYSMARMLLGWDSSAASRGSSSSSTAAWRQRAKVSPPSNLRRRVS